MRISVSLSCTQTPVLASLPTSNDQILALQCVASVLTLQLQKLRCEQEHLHHGIVRCYHHMIHHIPYDDSNSAMHSIQSLILVCSSIII